MIKVSSRDSFRSELINCLRRLAAPADAQAQYLRDLGVYPSVDELALEPHELVLISRRKVATGELSIAEKAGIERLDMQLKGFSGNQNASLWTVEALASADEWKNIRAMASECLRSLGAHDCG